MKTILTKNGYQLIKNKFTKEEIKDIKKQLTVKPYIPYSFGTKIKIETYKVYKEDDDKLHIPKFFGLKNIGKPDKNEEYKGVKSKMKFKGKLRPKQNVIVKDVLKSIKEKDGGLISLPCGYGKTVISLYLACKLKVKTLVIVHKSFLLNQWIERAEQFTNAKLGIIQQKKIDVEGKDIVIGMLQSIAKDKYDPEIFKDFGLVIFDEAHHAPSKYFSRALPIISCKKSIALSATPKRNDRLEKILFWYFGDLLYKLESQTSQNVLTKIYKYDLEHKDYREYKLPFKGDVNRPKTLTKICQIKKRNIFIIDLLKDILIEKGRKILILSDRIEHLDLLKELIDKKKMPTADYYIGGRKQKDLDEAAKAQIILATFSMAAEALDIPELNTLMMVTPRSSIEQSVGRILRKKDHSVQPLIIDLADNLKCFNNQSRTRRKFYRKKQYKTKLLEVKNNIILSEEDITKTVIKPKYIKPNLDDVDFID